MFLIRLIGLCLSLGSFVGCSLELVDKPDHLFHYQSFAANMQCPWGGEWVSEGFDTNRNHRLDTHEVERRDFFCLAEHETLDVVWPQEPICVASLNTDGYYVVECSDGQKFVLDMEPFATLGSVPLIAISLEAEGENCIAGGYDIALGNDVNQDTVLQASEVVHNFYFCHGVDGSDGADGANGKTTTISTTSEPIGENCAGGGQRIDLGFDANDDGLLSDFEIQGTSYLCNGDPGNDGLDGLDGLDGYIGEDGRVLLTKLGFEPAGENCSGGGQRLLLGYDDNINNILDADEIQTTYYFCNGTPGENGTDGSDGADGADGANGLDGVDGANGMQILVAIESADALAECAYAGEVIRSGLDLDNDGALSSNEVMNEFSICYGAPGQEGAVGEAGADGQNAFLPLLEVLPIESSEGCPAGGVLVMLGSDLNADGILSESEVGESAEICDGADGADGANGHHGSGGEAGQNGWQLLLRLEMLAPNQTCLSGGQIALIGFDKNESGRLDVEEIENSLVVCAGIDGANGVDGANGANAPQTLFIVTAEEPGDNCAAGGQVVQTGLDLDGSQTLNEQEVTQTTFLCDTDLTQISPQMHWQNLGAGEGCDGDWVRFFSGIDADASGELEETEWDYVYQVCNPLPVVSVAVDYAATTTEEFTVYAFANEVEGNPLTYFWNQLSGPSAELLIAQRTSATFLAPPVGEEISLEFEVCAQDTLGSEGCAPFAVHLGPSDARVIDFGRGSRHSCALLENGQVKCFGENEQGALGLGWTNGTIKIGDDPSEMGDALAMLDFGEALAVTSLAVGEKHNCAIFSNGGVKCWGDSDYGKTGQGTTVDIVSADVDWIDFGNPLIQTLKISAGDHSTCALQDDNEVRCWGRDFLGMLGRGTNGEHMGDQPGEMAQDLIPVDFGTNRYATDLDSGEYHHCALLDNQQIKCWGRNYYGQLGIGTSTTMGDSDNVLGDNLPEVDLGTGRSALAIALGQAHSCALLDNHQVKCWGVNNYGQLGLGIADNRLGYQPTHLGDNLPEVNLGFGRTAKAIFAGVYNTCVILDTDELRCWGLNNYGQLGPDITLDIVGGGPDSEAPGAYLGDDLPLLDFGEGRVAIKVDMGTIAMQVLLSDGTLTAWSLQNWSVVRLGLGLDTGFDFAGNDNPISDLGHMWWPY